MSIEAGEKYLLAELEKLGLKATFQHEQFAPRELDEWQSNVLVRGRTTLILKRNSDGAEVMAPNGAKWQSYCSVKDCFSKKKGRVITMARAVRALKPILGE